MTTPFSTQVGNEGGSPFPPQQYGTHLSNSLTVQLDAQHLFDTPVSVGAGDTITSSLVLTSDFNAAAFGFSAPADLTGALTMYLDDEGTIVAGTEDIASGTSGVAASPAGLLFRAVKVSLTNAGTSAVIPTTAVLVARSMM